ncbi:hypothetical protein D5047_20220 [Verminephrobacter eiseniae]|nr:hypothetical protein [Verminephrobacter eiseniae]
MPTCKPGLRPPPASSRPARQRGLSLIIVMLILIVVSILGVGGMRIAMMAERGTRNDRDMQIAWQAAEAGLVDAEFDITGQPANFTDNRSAVFKRNEVDLAKFIDNCGSAGKSIGLCTLKATGKPVWLTVDFEATDDNAKTVEFGKYTGRAFPTGSTGIRPAQKPRYLIEIIPDLHGARSFRTTNQNELTGSETLSYVYRVTAMGFGPNKETQAVLQMIYRN